MGIVRMGPPTDLISLLQKEFGIQSFVETGTYYGRTAEWAASVFNNVLTIEYSKDLFERAKESYKHVSNIQFLYGDSRTVLEQILPDLKEPVLFWLDAHWSGGITYGDVDQCPLLEEIEIINHYFPRSYIFIDDARLFTSPPQPPHIVEQWPDIFSVLSSLNTPEEKRYSVIIEDVIISVPQLARQAVTEYCQHINALAWQDYSEKTKQSNTKKALKLIAEDLKKPFRKLRKKLQNTLQSKG